jgi:tetratricopeptide (TPR) repeat protein
MQLTDIWEEEVEIPTYETGRPDKNPIFLENRVYQGSSGKIYPYPTIEKIYDKKTDRKYNAVLMENEYLKVMILPELGGRIQRAYDKTDGYDFVYYNHVIKPALVGLCGPWISGGIEFNWPQHHRPSTFMPADHICRKCEDGSAVCIIHDVDRINGSEMRSEITLHPGKAYIEIKTSLYNRTAMAQTFLWWANPAFAVNDHTQSIFPPDVHAVMDHGKRDVSRFPIATGTYYKHDYSAGVDISWYKNIPVPTSYMAEKSAFDFVGGYDYKVGAGLLHIADHHVSPGKKQWTWGCGEFGKAWDRNLTDSDGPYIELMTGMYTDNQPDFSWLKPMEEKTFTQYFMPYKTVGQVKNATVHACLNMEKRDGSIYISAYTTEKYEDAVIELTYAGNSIFSRSIKISPTEPFEEAVSCDASADETLFHVKLVHDGDILVEYSPLKKEVPVMPKPAEAAAEPDKIMTNEELYLTGLHIEQYRHATYKPDPYYLEGLKRDPGDIRINNAYGALIMRRGCFVEAERYFRKAIERATWKNPNPYDSEPYYNLGIDLLYQGRDDEAYDAIYKACWSDAQKEMGFYYLAAIEARRGKYNEALDFCRESLKRNSGNIKARGMLVYLLRKLGYKQEALREAHSNTEQDPFDFISIKEMCRMGGTEADGGVLAERCRGELENYLDMARDYAVFGAYDEAAEVLSACGTENPMKYYYLAYYHMLAGNKETGSLHKAAECCPDYVFPNKSEDIAVLEYAISEEPGDGMARYYLGNLMYDRLRYDRAVRLWEEAAELKPAFPTVWRNLSLGYYNKMHEPAKAEQAMEKAWKLSPDDPRIFMELDQLHKKLGMPVQERIAAYDSHKQIFMQRDDLIIEYITLMNLTGQYGRAYEMLMSHHFHPWEGGEGKVTAQYKIALVERARGYIRDKDWETAAQDLEKALIYPENLGEGKLEGCKDNDIYYYLGICAEMTGNTEKARQCYARAEAGTYEPAGVMYYNDQPADMIYYQGLAEQKTGRTTQAKAGFNKLLDYGERHLYDKMRIGYFAVSLPDFLIFNDDLDVRNKAHCYYLMGLGNMGLGNSAAAAENFRTALELSPYHQDAARYLKMAVQ